MKSLHHYKISTFQLVDTYLFVNHLYFSTIKKIKIQYTFNEIFYNFNHYFLVTGNYHESIHVLINLSSLYQSLVQFLEHDRAISCPLNFNLLNILLLRLLQVTNYIAFC